MRVTQFASARTERTIECEPKKKLLHNRARTRVKCTRHCYARSQARVMFSWRCVSHFRRQCLAHSFCAPSRNYYSRSPVSLFYYSRLASLLISLSHSNLLARAQSSECREDEKRRGAERTLFAMPQPSIAARVLKDQQPTEQRRENEVREPSLTGML